MKDDEREEMMRDVISQLGVSPNNHEVAVGQ